MRYQEKNYDWREFRSKSDERYAIGNVTEIKRHNGVDSVAYELNFLQEVIVKEFNAPLTGTALDTGCGGGWLSKALSDAGLSVTGMDISEKGIALAQQQFPEPTFKVGNGVTPHKYFDVETFDLIIARELHPFTRVNDYPYQRNIIDHYFSLIKPGGFMIIGQADPSHMNHPETGKPLEELDLKRLKRDLKKDERYQVKGLFHYHLHKKLNMKPRGQLDLMLGNLVAGLASQMIEGSLLRYMIIRKIR